jgi:hypothetical protein
LSKLLYLDSSALAKLVVPELSAESRRRRLGLCAADQQGLRIAEDDDRISDSFRNEYEK